MKLHYLVEIDVDEAAYNANHELGTAFALLRDEIQSNLESFDSEVLSAKVQGVEPSIDGRLFDVIRRFLTYSFRDTYFSYQGLTAKEQTFCTPEEFASLVAFVRKHDNVEA